MRAMYSVPQRRFLRVKEAVLGLLIVTDCQSSSFEEEEGPLLEDEDPLESAELPETSRRSVPSDFPLADESM